MVLAALVAALAPVAGQGAQLSPDWPCVQPLQPHLSLAQVWTGPQPDEARALASDPGIAALADRLAQRRLAEPDAIAAIDAWAQGQDTAHLAGLMLAVFDRIDRRRTALIDGVGRHGRAQVGLAASIESRRARMAELEKAEKPDFDAVDAEEKALDWDTRIFTERQRQLQYVCETPVILEKRLFALARAIAAHLAP